MSSCTRDPRVYLASHLAASEDLTEVMGCSTLSMVKLSMNGANVCDLAFVAGDTFRALDLTYGLFTR